eukprot:CAMPEP_0114178672 /NCGR_PEP_ID=MMETSP0043_2-20121206/38670_1 /TAXON_ID=464988 /ORGANISM="Hemiselmis andersenii, Strain CCMP644" /LENGTH=51 /DNA_ID=CAMNT_0001277103 /DNA_START=37 /DNA_END=189 /DNA_ORIENTATION=+
MLFLDLSSRVCTSPSVAATSDRTRAICISSDSSTVAARSSTISVPSCEGRK